MRVKLSRVPDETCVVTAATGIEMLNGIELLDSTPIS